MTRRFLSIIACLAALAASPLTAQERALGGLARLDAENSAITDRAWGRGTEVTLALSQGVPWRVFTLSDPARLVLDFREVDWGGVDPAMLDRSEAISEVHTGAYREGWSRLVALLETPMAV